MPAEVMPEDAARLLEAAARGRVELTWPQSPGQVGEFDGAFDAEVEAGVEKGKRKKKKAGKKEEAIDSKSMLLCLCHNTDFGIKRGYPPSDLSPNPNLIPKLNSIFLGGSDPTDPCPMPHEPGYSAYLKETSPTPIRILLVCSNLSPSPFALMFCANAFPYRQ